MPGTLHPEALELSKTVVLEGLKEAIIKFDIDNIKPLAENALKQGVGAYDCVMSGMAKGMEAVGEKYQLGEFFLPELVMAGETFKEGMEVFAMHLKPSEIESQGRVVIGTVEGDLHDIGKNIVASMVGASGFEVHDLGIDVSADRFLAKAKETSADIVAMSALLSTTFPHMKETIDSIRKAQMSSKTIVGGAPLNAETARTLGADGYGRDAVEGANICKQWAAARSQK
ncbi:cobalamin B12-binding domain-containing protein [[Eubacterium] cellulosolvens]